MKINRRELLVGAGALATASRVSRAAAENTATDVWLKTCRGLICEAYNPPFHPSFGYKTDRAVKIATELNADSMRAATKDTILLHLLADTGNKTKKLRIREEFIPVENIKARIRVPEGRKVKSVSLLRGGDLSTRARTPGWIEVTVPRVLSHDAVRVDLS